MKRAARDAGIDRDGGLNRQQRRRRRDTRGGSEESPPHSMCVHGQTSSKPTDSLSWATGPGYIGGPTRLVLSSPPE